MNRCLVVLCSLLFSACSTAGAEEPLPTLAQIVTPTLFVIEGEPIRLLDFWEVETSVLAPSSNSSDVWQFVAKGGDKITIRTVSPLVDTALTLFDPAGTELLRDTAIETTLSMDGVYTVRVDLTNSASGGYDIGLGYADQVNPASYTPTPIRQVVGVPTPTPPYSEFGRYISELVIGEERGGVLNEDEPAHIYTLDVTVGQIFNIELGRVDGTLDPFLTLFDPDGNPMAMDDNSGNGRNAMIRNFRVPSDGLYILQVTGSGFFGTYSLAMNTGAVALPTLNAPDRTPTQEFVFATPTLSPAIRGNRLQDHVPVIGNLERSGDFAQFSIYAVAGETITVGVGPWGNPGLRAQLDLYDVDGILMASTNVTDSADTANAILTGIVAPETGAYLVFVSAEDDGQAGGYLLSYGTGTTRQDVYRGEPMNNALQTSDLVWRGLRDVWQVKLNAGDVITVAASPSDTSLVDTLVEIVDSQGTVLSFDDNGGGDTTALINAYEILQDGTYFLRVRDATGFNTGAYTLVWRYINLAPTVTPLPVVSTLLTIDDFVPQGSYNFYVFQGQAGQRVRGARGGEAGRNDGPGVGGDVAGWDGHW